RLADMADAERIDETVERNRAPRVDGVEQVAHRRLAEAFLLKQIFPVLFLQREDIDRLLHPSFLEEQLDLLLAQALDVEGPPRAEQLQVLDLLEWTGKLAGAAGAGALLAGRGFFAHHVGVQIARAFPRKFIGFCVFRPPVDHHVDDLRNDVAGALDDHGVADPDVAAFAQTLALAPDAFYVV